MHRTTQQYCQRQNLESITGFAPEMLIDSIVIELESHLEEFLPEGIRTRLTVKLARKTERLFEVNEQYRRRACGRNGRTWLLSFYRHWLAGELAKSSPATFRRLPDHFKVGRPV